MRSRGATVDVASRFNLYIFKREVRRHKIFLEEWRNISGIYILSEQEKQ